jgi:hypothetical protein
MALTACSLLQVKKNALQEGKDRVLAKKMTAEEILFRRSENPEDCR